MRGVSDADPLAKLATRTMAGKPASESRQRMKPREVESHQRALWDCTDCAAQRSCGKQV